MVRPAQCLRWYYGGMHQAPDLREWATEHILEGVRQADADEFATDEEVEAAFSRWRDPLRRACR